MGRPGIRSAELTKHVHEAVLTTMPIVLMTTEPRDAAPLLVPGAVECLAKPFNFDDVLACVARYMQPTQAADQGVLCSNGLGPYDSDSIDL